MATSKTVTTKTTTKKTTPKTTTKTNTTKTPVKKQTSSTKVKSSMFKPANPRDPKMPNLSIDWEPMTETSSKSYDDVYLSTKTGSDYNDNYYNQVEESTPVFVNTNHKPKVDANPEFKNGNIEFVTAAYESLGIDENGERPKYGFEIDSEGEFKQSTAKKDYDDSIHPRYRVDEDDFVNELTEDEIKQAQKNNKTKGGKKLSQTFIKNALYDEDWDKATDGDLIPVLKKNKNENLANLINSLKEEMNESPKKDSDSDDGNKELVKEAFALNVNRDANGFIIPDPGASNRINSYSELYKRNLRQSISYSSTLGQRYNLNRGSASNGSSKSIVRKALTGPETKMIVDYFKHEVILVTKYEIVIKHNKYGYEIYFNQNDLRWWVVAITFDEPFNPIGKSMSYQTLWSGSNFIGYGSNEIDCVFSNAEKMFRSGRTANYVTKEYLVSYDIQSKRIFTSQDPVPMTLEEYKKFVTWYKKYKIEIFLKTKGKVDTEDLEKMAYENQRKGIRDIRIILGGKMADPPRRARYIFAYPIEKPKGAKKELTKPENKLYEIGFGVVD